MAKKNIKSTTQGFTEIVDIVDNVVLLQNKRACMMMEVSSVNFFLLSADEQNARVYGYMSLINSLSFAIQILIVSKKVDMDAYVDSLDKRITTTQHPQIKEHLLYYKEFIQELVKGEGLLDKKIYIVIPYSYLEGGAATVAQGTRKPNTKFTFSDQAKASLLSKAGVVMSQVERMGLAPRILSHEELIKVFYELLNDDVINLNFDSRDIKNVIV
jgi:hypothetical protein